MTAPVNWKILERWIVLNVGRDRGMQASSYVTPPIPNINLALLTEIKYAHLL